MPKHKKEESSDSDSGPEDRNPKKSKADSKKKSGSSSSGGEDNSWDLGKRKFVKLTEFKHNWYVNIREFYLDDGDLKPGKKGIMLTMEQWQKFKSYIDEIDESIKRNV